MKIVVRVIIFIAFFILAVAGGLYLSNLLMRFFRFRKIIKVLRGLNKCTCGRSDIHVAVDSDSGAVTVECYACRRKVFGSPEQAVRRWNAGYRMENEHENSDTVL